jgi:hypothetical protein
VTRRTVDGEDDEAHCFSNGPAHRFDFSRCQRRIGCKSLLWAATLTRVIYAAPPWGARPSLQLPSAPQARLRRRYVQPIKLVRDGVEVAPGIKPYFRRLTTFTDPIKLVVQGHQRLVPHSYLRRLYWGMVDGLIIGMPSTTVSARLRPNVQVSDAGGVASGHLRRAASRRLHDAHGVILVGKPGDVPKFVQHHSDCAAPQMLPLIVRRSLA